MLEQVKQTHKRTCRKTIAHIHTRFSRTRTAVGRGVSVSIISIRDKAGAGPRRRLLDAVPEDVLLFRRPPPPDGVLLLWVVADMRNGLLLLLLLDEFLLEEFLLLELLLVFSPPLVVAECVPCCGCCRWCSSPLG